MKKYRYRRSALGIPYFLFLLLFVIAPLLVIIYYAFTDGQGRLSFENFAGFFVSQDTLGTLFYSFVISSVTTVICLVLAYGVAYILSRGPFKRSSVLLLLFVMPMWINFTLRITALKEILTVLEGNLAYHPFLNTVLAMVYDFLPFMILPIYNTLAKIDDCYPEAAMDLGAGAWHVFTRVWLPLSMPGIISGVTMVFLPAMTNYVVLDMVYNSTYIMGSLIGSYFSSYDWNHGSLISFVMLLLVMLLSFVTGEFSDKEEHRK